MLVNAIGENELIRKLAVVGGALSGKHTPLSASTVRAFADLTLRGTTDPSRRKERGMLLRKMIDAA